MEVRLKSTGEKVILQWSEDRGEMFYETKKGTRRYGNFGHSNFQWPPNGL
jgi:hypothetical protein